MAGVTSILNRTEAVPHETTEYYWSQLVDMIAEAFGFSPDERSRFESKDIAKLIGAIPFLAGCRDPLRIAVSHLGTYILSVKLKDIADPRPSDDEYLFRRLELLSNFIGGDRGIIQRGMNLIALCMLSNYAHDAETDKEHGKYNPVVSGAVDIEDARSNLIEEIESLPCSDMDRIMTPKAAWDWGRFWIY